MIVCLKLQASVTALERGDTSLPLKVPLVKLQLKDVELEPKKTRVRKPRKPKQIRLIPAPQVGGGYDAVVHSNAGPLLA